MIDQVVAYQLRTALEMARQDATNLEKLADCAAVLALAQRYASFLVLGEDVRAAIWDSPASR